MSNLNALHAMSFGRRNWQLATSPVARSAGTTPHVYPGAIATGASLAIGLMASGAHAGVSDTGAMFAMGAADPAAEDRFNAWMDGFISMSKSRQLGEYNALAAKEQAGTLTSDEKRHIIFERGLLGIGPNPFGDVGPIKPAEVVNIENITIAQRAPSRWPMFFVFAAVAGVAVVATGKRKG